MFRALSTWATAVLIAVAICGSSSAVGADAPKPPEITGKISTTDGKPIAGVVVLAYNLSTGQVIASEPTTANGKYVIPGLSQGYHDIAVEAPEGLFIGNHVVNVPPKGAAVANLKLMAFDDETNGDPAARTFAGSDRPTGGMANLSVKPKGMTKGKIWLIGGGVGVAALAFAGGGSNGTPTAPPP